MDTTARTVASLALVLCIEAVSSIELAGRSLNLPPAAGASIEKRIGTRATIFVYPATDMTGPAYALAHEEAGRAIDWPGVTDIDAARYLGEIFNEKITPLPSGAKWSAIVGDSARFAVNIPRAPGTTFSARINNMKDVLIYQTER